MLKSIHQVVKTVAGCVSLGAFGCLVAAKSIDRGDTALQNAAVRYQQCLERGDAKCLYSFASSAERKKLGLSEAKFEKFASGIVWPALRGMVPQGAARRFALDGEQNLVRTGDSRVVYEEKAGPRHIVVIQRYKNPAGKIDTLKFELTTTPDGVKSSSLIGGLYLTSLSAFAPKEEVRQWKKYAYWSSLTKSQLPLLKGSGVKGYVADAFKSGGPVSWDEWIRYWDSGNAARGNLVPPMGKLPTRGGK